MNTYSTSIILETRTPRKDGTFPVKIRLIINRKSRYYSLNEYLTKDQFEKAFSSKRGNDLKKIAQGLNDAEKRAMDILKTMETPNFDQFKRLFTMKGSGGNIVKYYKDYIRECKNEGRYGTASSYECSLNSLNEVKGIESAGFRDVTPAWLKDYESKMKKQGKSISTIGIYLRPLRKLFNDALRDGVISINQYPFGETKSGKYRIPKGSNNKRPLEMSELIALTEYKGSVSNEMYRDFFMLSYSLAGLNFMDLLTLKWKQLNGNVLTVIRKKTENTTRGNQQPIVLYVNEQANEIIKKYGNTAGTYIFDVVSVKDSPEEIRRKVQNFNRNTNQALKAIAKKTPGINTRISAVFARHSAVSHAIEAGVSLPTIQQAEGHTSIKTTSNYASSLGKGYIDLANALTIKTTVPETEHGTNSDETQQQQGIDSVPDSVPVEQ